MESSDEHNSTDAGVKDSDSGESSTDNDSDPSRENEDDDDTSSDNDSHDTDEEREDFPRKGHSHFPMLAHAPPKMRIKLSLKQTTKGFQSCSPLTTANKIMPAPPVINQALSAIAAQEPSPATTGSNGEGNEIPLPPKKPSLMRRAFKLPMSSRSSNVTSKSDDDDEEEDGDAVVKATVVDSDDSGEDDAVAAIVFQNQLSSSRSTKATKTTKRRSMLPSRPMRLPPIASPGLLMLPISGLKSIETATKTGYATPSAVFDHHMSLAGYSEYKRTSNPHRGSSVQRMVGDMFDSDIVLARRFPDLMPRRYLEATESKDDNYDLDLPESERTNPSLLPRVLIASLSKSLTLSNTPSDCKRKRPMSFKDMIPVSLSVSYPKAYVKQRQQYIKDVATREKAIIGYQAAQENLDSHEGAMEAAAIATIPPLPAAPVPPKLADLTRLPFSDSAFEDAHPFYPPKGKGAFVAHLDSNSFHLTEGRYFGLQTNHVADPNFVGANAPGISGIHASGGAGLATSNAGGGVMVGSAMTLSTSYHRAANGGSHVSSHSALGSKSQSLFSTNSNKEAPVEHAGTSPKINIDRSIAVKSLNTPSVVTSSVGPKPTASATDLRKVMEEGVPEQIEAFRSCIIKAAVHSSRSGRHGHSFVGPNGAVYPDASKAFASHTGIKPCQRCKNNKQGVRCCVRLHSFGLLSLDLIFNFCFSDVSLPAASTS